MRCVSSVLCATVLLAIPTLTEASAPLMLWSLGSAKITAGVSAASQSQFDGAKKSFGGDVFVDATAALNKTFAIQYRHSEPKLGMKRYGITTDGKVKEDDVRLVCKLVSPGVAKPMVAVYAGVKKMRVSAGDRNASKTGGVGGIQVGYRLPASWDVYADYHYAKQAHGFEVGVSKNLAPMVNIDASYYNDRYKYSGHTLRDNGMRIGLTLNLEKPFS